MFKLQHHSLSQKVINYDFYWRELQRIVFYSVFLLPHCTLQCLPYTGVCDIGNFFHEE